MTTPTGWMLTGRAPEAYAVATEPSDRRRATAAVLRSTLDAPSDFATLMQDFTPVDYRGQRVRLSAWVRTDAVKGWCGLWMRVDGAAAQSLAFDNMAPRAIRGTTGWGRYEVVLDVPLHAELIAFGILLHGPGAAWIDEVALDVVGLDVPVTDLVPRPQAPRNLDFSET